MKKLLPFLALIPLAAPNRAHAAVDYILNGSGVFNCNDTSHAEPGFPVASFSLGGTDPVTVSAATGSGAGKISLSNLTINRTLDGCSEALIRAFLGQAHAPTLTLKAYRTAASGKPTVVLYIKLSNAFVTSYQINGSDINSPQEAVSFSYDTVQIESVVINPDGSLGSTVTVTYNLKSNTVS